MGECSSPLLIRSRHHLPKAILNRRLLLSLAPAPRSPPPHPPSLPDYLPGIVPHPQRPRRRASRMARLSGRPHLPTTLVPFPTCISSLPFESEYVYIHHLPNSTRISDVVCTRTAITDSDSILVQTSTELEFDFLQILSELHKKPIVSLIIIITI